MKLADLLGHEREKNRVRACGNDLGDDGEKVRVGRQHGFLSDDLGVAGLERFERRVLLTDLAVIVAAPYHGDVFDAHLVHRVFRHVADHKRGARRRLEDPKGRSC